MKAPFYELGLFGEEASLLFAVLIGIGFGFFPARRAAQMNPIDALRFE